MDIPSNFLPDWPFIPIWSPQQFYSHHNYINLFFNYLGILSFIYLAYRSFLFVKEVIIDYIYHYSFLSTYGVGSWAVIFGANDLVGREFSKQLAARGFNIALITKNPMGMEELVQELKGVNSSIAIKTIYREPVIEMKYEFVDDIMDELRNCEISMLVNNMEVMMLGKELHECNTQELNEMILSNFLPQLTLARYMIPRLSKRDHQSAIINITFGINDAPLSDVVGNVSEVFNDFLGGLFSVKYPNTQWISLRCSPFTKMKEEGENIRLIHHEKFNAHGFVRKVLRKLSKKKAVI